MALNIQDLYYFFNTLINKEQSNEISDSQFNSVCAFVNLDIFRKYAGVPEDYQPNNPTPRIAWQMTNTVSDDLRNFIVTREIPINNSGYFPFPDDYSVFSSMWYRYLLNNPNGGNPTNSIRWIENVSDGELRLRLTSNIKYPTPFYPVCAWYSYGFKVYPEDIKKVDLTYLKTPVTPFRNFTQLANDETEYNSVGSIQFEYPQTIYPDIAIRIGKYLGITIREDQFIAYMQQRQQEGN